MHVWRKLVPADSVDAWMERLAVIPRERLAIIQTARARSRLRIEVYTKSAKEAARLAAPFGGAVFELPDNAWQPSPGSGVTAMRPLRIGHSLVVTAREDALAALQKAYPKRHVLRIPAAMAFGTGAHATTAMCLRLLNTVAGRQPAHTPWDLLDLGTGSGILALAGRLFGAGRALGLENDPGAVRAARSNARLNGVRGVRFDRADLLCWQPPRKWPVVTANLFSELLIQLLPMIGRALAGGGFLIASGVLAEQSSGVEGALRQNGLQLLEVKRRGRWRAFLARKPLF